MSCAWLLAFQSEFVAPFTVDRHSSYMLRLTQTTRIQFRRQVPHAITRRLSDIERYHYPEGTDKQKARAFKANEKKRVRKERERLRQIPHGYGLRPGAGVFPYDNAERAARERDAHFHRHYPNPDLFHLEEKAMMKLTGDGKADGLLELLRARYMERAYDREQGESIHLTEDIPHVYKALVDEIIQCDEAYYADDPQPRVSDAEYDELIMHLLELERTFPELIVANSPSQTVGHAAAARAAKLGLDSELHGDSMDSLNSFNATVSTSTRRFPQYRHRVPMLSLDNAYGHEDLVSFFRRATIAKATVAAELKIDGVALSLEYRRGVLVAAATRGSGRIGDNVLANVKFSMEDRGVVQKINSADVPDWMIIRGEVYIAPADFTVVNATLERPLSNARNAAAGALMHKDPEEAARRRIQFVAYDCIKAPLVAIEAADSTSSNMKLQSKSNTDILQSKALEFQSAFDTQAEALQALAEWGFGRMPRAAVCVDLEAAENFAKDVEQTRDNLLMPIDGIVFKWNESRLREKAGTTARAPRAAIAYKFTAQARATNIVDVVMQVSRKGIITPVAILSPVLIGGAMLSRATLHNFDEVGRLGVAVGDAVIIERGGDVIPKVIGVKQKASNNHRRLIEPPAECPCCGSQVNISNDGKNASTQYICTNNNTCVAQTFGRIVHFAGRDAMDIKGLGRRTVQKLIDAGLVVVIADLFRLTLDDIRSLDGYADASATALLNTIKEAAHTRSLERIFIGLGLPGVGRVGARSLAQEVRSIGRLLEIGAEPDGVKALLAIPNIAEKTASALHNYLHREQYAGELKAIAQLVHPQRIVDEEDASIDSEKNYSVTGKSFAFTGKFDVMNRTAVIKWVKTCGGRVMSDVSRKTDFVIYGTEPGQKLFKAQRLKLCVIPETEFFEFFKITEEIKSSLQGSAVTGA